jgi:hypothetical protein
MPRWLVIGLESGIPWPTKETRVLYKSREILLRPETDKLAPTIVLAYDPPGTHDEALIIGRQFLSALAWVENGYLREMMITGGSHPIQVGKGVGKMVTPQFRADYLPAPENPKAQLALAFYREAKGLNSIAYQFLGFFKILNVLFASGPQQIEWINSVLDKLEDHLAEPRLRILRQSGEDIGDYLYRSGRCAVAHAFAEPLVDPDNVEDGKRLQEDLPVIKALAEYLIEHELGVLSLRTVWREHLYELDGFRKILGPEIVNALKAKSSVPAASIPTLPKLSVRLRGHAPFPAFEALSPVKVETHESTLAITCRSEDGIMNIGLLLRFDEERLRFDPMNGVVILDDGTEKPINYAMDQIGVIKGLLVNGQLEVWNSDHGVLLGRTDPFMPVNIDLVASLENFDRNLEQLRSESTRRKSGETKAPDNSAE